jgi:hypothetical protein
MSVREDENGRLIPANYETWIDKVDLLLRCKIGLTHSDIPDQLWRDAYEDGTTPLDAITGFFGDMDDLETFMHNAIMGGE